MTEFFEGRDIAELIQRITRRKWKTLECLRVVLVTPDQIILLHINFHKLPLTRGSCYIELSEWIAKEKAKVNQKNKQCFKWAVIAAVHHEEIAKDPLNAYRS